MEAGPKDGRIAPLDPGGTPPPSSDAAVRRARDALGRLRDALRAAGHHTGDPQWVAAARLTEVMRRRLEAEAPPAGASSGGGSGRSNTLPRRGAERR